mmetsp:Transcript_25753/g.22852  ORF Transcript_25753/g.22852 Transcript_25753/m.22852 type:complete len:93 (+) Transcript_25753:387-665(+)
MANDIKASPFVFIGDFKTMKLRYHMLLIQQDIILERGEELHAVVVVSDTFLADIEFEIQSIEMPNSNSFSLRIFFLIVGILIIIGAVIFIYK